ncbi:hypothetical protein SAMN05421827_102287 [Pedobacter terrae]|uniref:Uncharacterized protein n=1 Tax=Pedobacter terrae TaxID=405671 RepID=A0A1G7QFZ2_9SPHI|nr:hypothetical protein [Pedobacter terrae]SDF97424.1 hypothetical protein SAMN05421827_102287 [Pedobacter terrae]
MLKKINLGLVALVLGFGLIATQSAFTTTRATTFWAYQPNPENNLRDYTKYMHISTPSAQCTAENEPLPCVIEVPETVVTQSDLQVFFAGKTDSQILELSAQRTPEQ